MLNMRSTVFKHSKWRKKAKKLIDCLHLKSSLHEPQNVYKVAVDRL